MAYFVTTELVERAFRMAEPSIQLTLAETAKRVAGHLRVTARSYDKSRWVLLATRDYGSRAKWEHDYPGHATAKEAISQRTGKSTREVQLMHPEMLEAGDTVYYGSVVSPDGSIVVAFSGVEAWFDEMFASWVLTAILALIQHELERQRAAGNEYYEA